MERKTILTCFLVCILAAQIGSCSPGDNRKRQEAVDAVRNYNRMLQRTYLEADLNLMRNVATMNEINKLFPLIQALRSVDNVMIAEQKTFEIKKVSARGKSAYVESEETWTYWWQHRETAEITKTKQTITYKIRYNLIQENNSWKVDNLESVQ
ncbi:MAG: hypothetical protein ACM34I_02595 [bacterium]